MPIDFSVRTGNVRLEGFDRGVKESLDAQVEVVSGPVGHDQGITQKYFIDVPELRTFVKVPVLFNFPEQPFTESRWAYVVVRRDSINPDQVRWQDYGAIQYRIEKPITTSQVDGAPYTSGGRNLQVQSTVGFVAGDAIRVTGGGKTSRAVIEEILGPFVLKLDRNTTLTESFPVGSAVFSYNQVEQKVQALPFEITYGIVVRARWAEDAERVLMYVLKKFQPVVQTTQTGDLIATALRVRDDVHEDISYPPTVQPDRTYEFFLEGVSSTYETEDVNGRQHGYELTYRCLAELDLNPAEDLDIVTQLELTAGTL